MILTDRETGRPRFVYVSWIAATPEKVFEALTNPEFTQAYWFGTRIRSDWKAGDPIVFDIGERAWEAGSVIENDPPRRLVYSWRADMLEATRGEPDSRVVMDIEPHGEVVKLTVAHDGFAPGSVMLSSISRGWPAVISYLKSLVEKGGSYGGRALHENPPPLPAVKGAGGRAPETVYTVFIESTPEAVWEALTSGDFTRRYFFGRTVESDWKEGSDWRLTMEDGRTDVAGKVLVADAPRHLQLSWRVEWIPEFRGLPECWVDYFIEPQGEAVRLTMMESHAAPLEDWILEGGRNGWPAILSNLKSVLETGKSLKLPSMKPPEQPA
jgi:uncharacterized protein YndB with AHSA1/START domain